MLSAGDSEPMPAPDWAQDLVIYEIATRGFTSPNGPESGTFNSLAEKLPYLAELGINAIWLTGHSWSDSSHFYGIWTQYACVEPDKLDPSLGTEEEFKAMIDKAHELGIRIFLDTIEHGVMNYSELISRHPEWFKGGSWGMTDYDWEGDHPDLEEWWINIWTKAALDWGVDGFRCDMGLHRPDLWEEIKRRCTEAGKPIFILGESGRETISHASQRDIMLYDIRKGRIDTHAALNDLAAIEDLRYGEFSGKSAEFQCEVRYGDEVLTFSNDETSPPRIIFQGFGPDVVGRWEVEPEGDPDWTFLLKGIDSGKPYDHIRLFAPNRSWHWQTEGRGWQLHVEKVDGGLQVSGGNPLPGEKFRVIAPSCHDCGWDKFPLDRNPYSVQGSRHAFGYAALLAPAIPLFMSGEEFDAQYRPLPRHTPGLFGEGEPGTGRWLYASWLQWDRLDEPGGQAMFKDVKRMLEIRSEHSDLMKAIGSDDEQLFFKPVEFESEVNLPVPYILTNGTRAVLIVGNPTNETQQLTVVLSAEDLGFGPIRKLKITHVWPREGVAQTVRSRTLKSYSVLLPQDGVPGGGLQVIRFEPLP